LYPGEDELVAGCIAEDRSAQRQLFNRFAPKMKGVCYRYVQSATEADDIVQDAFVKVFDNLKKFRKESSLETWITRITVNTAINHLKASRKFRMESELTIAADVAVSELQMQTFDTRVVMDCIASLPYGYRVVLNMYAIEGYSHKEIAEALGINESTSRSQFIRGRNILEKKLSLLGAVKKSKYAGR
jgi:RNA polymerase sigma-70 factor (ECF subfamily)